MELEISFNNLYHYYQDQEDQEDQEEELIDNSFYNFDIEDNKNEISIIETNNPLHITINTTIKKTLLNKKKIYSICARKNGYIKIIYKNKLPEIIPINSVINDTVKIGSLSGDSANYWLEHDPFIGKKHVDCMYTYNTSENDIVNHLNICYQMGAECKFIYNQFDTNFIKNSDYLSKYMNDFSKYIKFISTNKCKELHCTVIYEPYLLEFMYNSGNRDPNNAYLGGDLTLVEFINELETLCLSKKIELVIVFNPRVFKDLIHKVTNILDFPKYLNVINNKASQVAEYLTFFKNKNTKYLAFEFYPKSDKLYSNDEYLASLQLIKCILEKTKLKGILFGIPVGHVNGVKSISKYTNKPYNDHIDKHGDYQDTATFFFFGGCAIFNEPKFRQNKFNDDSLTIEEFTICCDEHISLCNKFNIKYLMFGPTNVNNDTTNVPLNSRGNKCTDHNYTICKISEYNSLEKPI